MFICRAITGKALTLAHDESTRANAFLHGVHSLCPQRDAIFRKHFPGATSRDSLVVPGMTAIGPAGDVQVHCERVVFDTARVYPEYAVYYKVE